MDAPSDSVAAAPLPASVASPRPDGRPWLQRLLGPFYVTGIFWWNAIQFASRNPEPLRWVYIYFFTWLFFLTLVRQRRTIAGNLEAVLGPCGFVRRQRRIFRTFLNHAWSLLERFEQFRPDFRVRIDLGGEGWGEVARAEHGFVLVTAHFGNWEIGPQVGELVGSRTIHVVREREEYEVTQQRLESLLRQRGMDRIVTHFLSGDFQLGTTLLQALRQGDLVTLAGDRALRGQATIETTLFGRPVDMPLGPAALARAADVPLLPVFLFRIGRRHYRFVARSPFRVAATPDRKADLQKAVDRFARDVEWAVREEPHHWVRWEPVFKD